MGGQFRALRRLVDSLDWQAFPQALIASDGKFVCDTMEDRIIEVKGLLDYVMK